MADIKISALPGASTLDGTETIPLVQGGTTKKVTTDQFLIKDASGNVGIGTASPGSKLEIGGGTSGQTLLFGNTGTNGTPRVASTLAFRSSAVSVQKFLEANITAGYDNFYDVCFFTDNGSGTPQERARINASGNLGLGVAPSAWGTAMKAVDFAENGRLFGSYSLASGNNAFFNGTNWIYKNTAAASMYVQPVSGQHQWYTAPSGTAGNAISFTQAMTLDASGVLTLTPTTSQAALFDYSGGAYTTWQHSGTSLGDIGAANQVIGGGSSADFAISSRSGSLVLGTANGVERARIDASGNLLVGTTSTINDSIVAINAGATWGLGIKSTISGGVNYFAQFFDGASGIGSITGNGSTVAYNTSSDYRLKNIIGPVATSGAYIDSLNPVEGTWKTNGEPFVGLIAHEVQDASRTTVATGVKDGPEMQAMDYSSAEIIANLIAEVKSLRARVAALETA